MSKSGKTIYFLCSPSLGILDNWLPVINFLSSSSKSLKFVLIFSKTETVRQLDLNNILVEISQSIFDLVVYPTDSGLWVSSGSVNDAYQSVGPLKGFVKVIYGLKIKLQRFKWLNYLMIFIFKILKVLDRFKYNSNFFDVRSISKGSSVLLCDVYEDGKPYNKEILFQLSQSPRFSIYHGIGIDEMRRESRCGSVTNMHNLKAYLFSEFEIDYYKKTFCLKDENLSVVGIPRHDLKWMKKIKKTKSSNDLLFKKGDYVFIISRPTCDYIPIERRIEALKNIKLALIDNLGLKIIIKLHPKETETKLYDQIFDHSKYGETWSYSNLHSFILGENSKFAISFFSGVAIDMMKIGIPTIEYLDLTDIEGYDNDGALRDGIFPVLGYRNLGLVYGASNLEQFESNVSKIINHRDQVNLELKETYEKYFKIDDVTIEKIASDILIAL